MSCYLIKVENGHKVARSITSEEEYKQLRGSNEQKANLRLARAGNDAAKRRLVQFNYSGHYPQGVVKGMKLPSGAFGFDMDEPEAFAKAAKLLLKEPDKYGLLMLERSARQGGHAVFVREKGKTVLENQVRIATMLKCEMDTSAHDINRVYFTTTSDDEDLLFLSPRLFKDEYDEAAVAAEGKVLEERERYGQEELPEEAHKANKHYEPWKEIQNSQGALKSQEFKNSRISSSAASTSAASTSATSAASAARDNYLGIPYGEIIKSNIEYDALLQANKFDEKLVQGIFELILETVVSQSETILIASERYPAALVKSKFLKLNYMHIDYVISCMKKNTTKVKNIKKYLLAALFNAPLTIDGYYQAEVNADMPHWTG